MVVLILITCSRPEGIQYASLKLTSVCGNHFCYCTTFLLQTKLWKIQTNTAQEDIHEAPEDP